MRILLVDQLSRLTGHDTFMFAKELNNQGCEIDVVNGDYSLNDFGINHYDFYKKVLSEKLFKKIILYINANRLLLKLIKHSKYDIVCLQWFLLPWIEHKFVKKIKKYSKVIITVHDVIPLKIRFKELYYLNKIYKNSDAIILFNNKALEVFSKTYSCNTRKYVTSSAFCDKREFDLIEKKQAREKLGIPENKFVYLFYGSIRDSKGLDCLIDSFASIQKEMKDSFLLVGGAFQKTSPEKYIKLCEKYLNEANSKIMFEFVPNDLERYYFRSADVVCLPYKNIFQSGIAQLALMYEVPMIVSNVGDLPSCVDNWKNGIVYDVDGDDGLKKAMEQIRDLDYSSVALHSRKIVNDRFSLVSKAVKTKEIFNTILTDE